MAEPTPVDWASPHAVWAAVSQGEATLVDIRTAAEFDAGHVPGALHVPLHTLVPAAAQRSASSEGPPPPRRALRSAFAADMQAVRGARSGWLVLMCRTGARSKQALQVLRALGLPAVAHLVGGWDGQVDAWGRHRAVGWRDSGLPTHTPTAGSVEPGHVDPTPRGRGPVS